MKSIAAVETLEVGRHDERGRRIADEAEKKALVAAYEASGMTQRAFTRREGINYFTFAAWLRKKRLQAMAPGPKRPSFLEVGLRPAMGFPLEVAMPDGVVVRGTHGLELAALVRALR